MILSANGRSVAKVEDLEEIVRTAKDAGREAVLLQLRPRNGPPLLVPIRLR
jgi:hypothetical protein